MPGSHRFQGQMWTLTCFLSSSSRSLDEKPESGDKLNDFYNLIWSQYSHCMLSLKWLKALYCFQSICHYWGDIWSLNSQFLLKGIYWFVYWLLWDALVLHDEHHLKGMKWNTWLILWSKFLSSKCKKIQTICVSSEVWSYNSEAALGRYVMVISNVLKMDHFLQKMVLKQKS